MLETEELVLTELAVDEDTWELLEEDVALELEELKLVTVTGAELELLLPEEDPEEVDEDWDEELVLVDRDDEVVRTLLLVVVAAKVPFLM